MNEETKIQSQEEKPLDEKRKKALLRYLGIMFVVAFILVTISMFAELRTNEATILELNQSSTSALNKVEQLQENNRQLETDNAYLQGRIKELEYRLDIWDQELEEAETQITDLQFEVLTLQEELEGADAFAERYKTAHDLLAQIVLADAAGEDYSDLTAELCNLELEHLFTGYAAELYKILIEKGEE